MSMSQQICAFLERRRGDGEYRLHFAAKRGRRYVAAADAVENLGRNRSLAMRKARDLLPRGVRWRRTDVAGWWRTCWRT